jgi:hypothetical protein
MNTVMLVNGFVVVKVALWRCLLLFLCVGRTPCPAPLQLLQVAVRLVVVGHSAALPCHSIPCKKFELPLRPHTYTHTHTHAHTHTHTHTPQGESTVFRAHTGAVNVVKFSSDGSFLLTGIHQTHHISTPVTTICISRIKNSQDVRARCCLYFVNAAVFFLSFFTFSQGCVSCFV